AGDFTNLYYRSIGGLTTMQRTVLQPANPFRVVEPRFLLRDPFDNPFFFEDKRHIFYVTTSEKQVGIVDYPDYGHTLNPRPLQSPKIPPLVLRAVPTKDPR